VQSHSREKSGQALRFHSIFGPDLSTPPGSLFLYCSYAARPIAAYRLPRRRARSAPHAVAVLHGVRPFPPDPSPYPGAPRWRPSDAGASGGQVPLPAMREPRCDGFSVPHEFRRARLGAKRKTQPGEWLGFSLNARPHARAPRRSSQALLSKNLSITRLGVYGSLRSSSGVGLRRTIHPLS